MNHRLHTISFVFAIASLFVGVSCNDNGTNSDRAILVGRAHVLGGSDPVSDAVVTAQGQSTRTDSNGQFRIDNLDPGQAVVNISKAGFKPFSTTVDLRPGASENFSFAMEPE